MDRVEPRLFAAVLADGAATGGHRLGRGVAHVIAPVVARAVEDVVQVWSAFFMARSSRRARTGRVPSRVVGPRDTGEVEWVT